MKKVWVAFLLWTIALPLSAAERLTYIDLVRSLTDLESLAKLPLPGEKGLQWSSYDRASRYDEATGKYIAWDANGDGGGIIRREGSQVVMAEMEGPGCIRRIWSAAPRSGHVKIYLDGATEPAVDLPFSGYFDLKNAPFIYPSLVHNASSGMNCYVPIPYRKSCRIVAEGDWGDYYHFTYTTYPEGTVLPTFRRDLSARETAALAAADKTLSEGLGEDPAGSRKGEVTLSKVVRVSAGKAAVVARLKGPSAITAVKAYLRPMSREEECSALRELAIRITWDDEREPAVWSPLGDFFGTAPGVNLYRSLPMGMTEKGFYSYWYMPFARSVLVEVVNEGAKRRQVAFALNSAPLTHPVESLGRFHAKWHRDALLPSEPERGIDWTMLKTEGAGRFCGVGLHVWNPKGGWWGEGDEKFFVDGEKFPSTIGTGSEDYFGYAWCNPALFQNAFHNQPYNSGNNKGHASVNRWHIADNIPFQSSFEAAIEKYYPNDRPALYAGTVYWYLAPGGKDPYAPVPVRDRTDYFTAEPAAFRVPGALEGERLAVLEKTGGVTQTQDMGGFEGQWSGDAHLWWTEGKPGDRLTLKVTVPKKGRYALTARFTKARDYGIVRLSLDGKPLAEAIDLYNPAVIVTVPLSLGTHQLSRGDHKLTVEIVGANQNAVPAYMCGLDYIQLQAR
ncbi:MAG: DUF2961 domain-containing protein [Armatimonadetes bacterium]|nr:DUF2961 domain-containing protein [Armatimonadota bacterium]